MKTWYYLFVLAFSVACNAEKVESSQYTQQVVAINDCGTQPDTTDNGVINTTACNIHVYSVNHPTQTELVVHTDDGEKMLAEIRESLPGELVKFNSADLNQNNAPELYVWCKTAEDSATLLAFELQGTEYRKIAVPTPKVPSATNYELSATGIIEQGKNSAIVQYRLDNNGVLSKI